MRIWAGLQWVDEMQDRKQGLGPETEKVWGLDAGKVI